MGRGEMIRRCFMSGTECHKYTKHFSPDPNRAFVIMPFREEFFDIYEFGIKAPLKDMGIDAVNGRDSYFLSGEYIICNICEEIMRAGLVVADISDGNPNVYYEFGLALALRRKCIVLHRATTTFATRFKNLLNSPGCTPQQYDSIKEVPACLTAALKTLKSYSLNTEMSKPSDPPCHITAIVGEHVGSPVQGMIESVSSTRARRRPYFRDLVDYGIRSGLSSLDQRLPRSLTDLRMGEVPNIADCEDDIDTLISKLMTCRYCVVDVHDKSLEAYFWMGFLHGLGVNVHVTMRPDLSFLYISSDPDMSKLPFDIQAVRVEHYTSLEHASTLIVNEIVSREIEKLDRDNRERHSFWKEMTFANTKFLIGALDVYLPLNEERYRSKVSLQDFKTFDMITYLMMLGHRIPFEYDRHFVRVSDYLPAPKDPDNTISESTAPIEAQPKDLIPLVRRGPDTPMTALGEDVPQEPGRRDYVVMIGSSCANPATQMLFKHLYAKSDSYRFKTTKPYKARGFAWEHVATPADNNVGIFVNEATLGDATEGKMKQYANSGYRRHGSVEIERDAGLLVVTNAWPSKDPEPPEQTIVLSGFRKLGTYFMAYLLAHYSPLDRTGQVPKRRGRPLLIRNHDGVQVLDSDFLSVLTRALHKMPKDREYCLEAIFEFQVQQDRSSGGEGCCIWEIRLTEFFSFDRRKGKRHSILGEVVDLATRRASEEDES